MGKKKNVKTRTKTNKSKKKKKRYMNLHNVILALYFSPHWRRVGLDESLSFLLSPFNEVNQNIS